MEVKNINDILKVVNPKSYPEAVQDIKKDISIDNDASKYFGSFTYKSQPYPSDIDLVEEVEYYDKKQSQDYAVNQFIKDIKQIIRRVLKNNNLIFSEFKAGKDYRYDPFGYKLADGHGDIYHEQENIIGKVQNHRVEKYKYKEMQQFAQNLHTQKLITDQEYETLKQNIKPKITIPQFENIYFLLRQYLIIRWTPKEILQGYKMLRGNYKMTLFEAFSQTEPDVQILIKLDVLSFINNKFIELTNTYTIYTCYSKSKQCSPINMEMPTPEQIKTSLISDIYYLAYSPTDHSPFKLSKRMWALSRLTKNIKVLNKLQPLLTSDIGGIRQIASELDTINLTITKAQEYAPKRLSIINKQINQQLDNMKIRLSKNIHLKLDDDKMFDTINKAIKTPSLKTKHTLLTPLEDYIKSAVNAFTERYLKIQKLLPLPKEFVPSDKVLRYY